MDMHAKKGVFFAPKNGCLPNILRKMETNSAIRIITLTYSFDHNQLRKLIRPLVLDGHRDT